MSIYDAPLWGQAPSPRLDDPPPWIPRRLRGNFTNNWLVDPAKLAHFAFAAASRYSGRFHGLPRVRYWQVWNEPNLSLFLNPQIRGQLMKKPAYPFDPRALVSPQRYRTMVNAFSAAVHRVRAGNVVIAGALSPFSRTQRLVAIGPLLFMRQLLCMSGDPVPKPTCHAKVHFDVWAVHPYTSGGPTHSATLPEDVSLGDLPEVTRLLHGAIRAGHVVSRHRVDFWVTEFGWDTRPPDAHGVPLRLHARWVAESLYRMWRDGVSLVVWYGLRDEARHGRSDGAVIQTGLYFRAATLAKDKPKPALAAFRFPFVAFRTPSGILIWGRTPWGSPGTVVVEQSSKRGWEAFARLPTDRFGVFSRTLPSSPQRFLRARLVGASAGSRPFALQVPPDLAVNAFGG